MSCLAGLYLSLMTGILLLSVLPLTLAMVLVIPESLVGTVLNGLNLVLTLLEKLPMISQAILYLSLATGTLLLPGLLMQTIPEYSDGMVPNGLNLVLTLMEKIFISQAFPYLSQMTGTLLLLGLLIQMPAIPKSSVGTVPNGLNLVLTLMEKMLMINQAFPSLFLETGTL